MMKMASKVMAASVIALGIGTAAHAAPIAGVTYTYDASTSPFNGFAPDAGGQLTDGVHGSLTPDPLVDPLAAFRNGTWVGFTENGAANPQPGVNLDLGGTYNVDSVEIEFLIEPGPFIFAPQTPTGGNALSILSGITVLNTFDVFPAIDFGQQPEIFTAVVPLGGVSLSALTVDVRSPYDHIFVAEITVNEVPEPASLGLLGLGGLAMIRRR
ncbi:MAG: PEP-CTERM sorting domain-containing protein [Phycisphaerales bacterium]